MSYPAIDPIIADIDQRLHVLEIAPESERVAALEEADEVLTTRLDGLLADQDAQDAAIDALRTDTTSAYTTLEGVSATLSAHGGRITDLGTQVDGNATALTGLSNRVDGKASLVALQSLANETGSALGSLSSDLSSAEAELTTLTGRVAALEATPPVAGATWPGTVLLTSFPGNSTAQLRSALAYVAAATDGRKPAIVIPGGTVLAPGTTPFMIASGTAILGGLTPETEFSPNSRVSISGAAPNGVFDHANDARSITIANIGWEGPGLSQVCRFMADGSNRLCYSLFDGVSFDNFTSVMRKRFLGFLWQGSGYCNNSSETPFEFSGSDYKVFMDGYYLDSPNLKDTDNLLHIKSGNKVTVGEVFVTGDGPTPVRVSGGQMVRLRGLEMEAEGVPRKTAGAGLLITGGNVIVDNAWFFRTMFNPTSVGHLGVIHVEGAGTLVRVKHATFGEYNVTPERPGGHTENHVYAGGSARVYLDCPTPWNMQANSGVGGTTNARPLQVQKAGTATISAAAYAAL